MSREQDLTGLQFGHLTVLRRAQGTQSGYANWLCRCSCGKEIIVSSRQLKRRTVQSCGCLSHRNSQNGRMAEDLSGQVFGRLTVLKRIANKNGRVCWLCRCACGNEKTCTAHDLKQGKVKSCGCLKNQEGKNYKDITNHRFGRLVAIKPTQDKDSKGSYRWQCRCDCGNLCIVTEDALSSGNTVSCGCRKKEIMEVIGQQVQLYEGTSYSFLRYRTKVRADSQIGHRGITVTPKGVYKAYIGFKGKRYYLGTYKELADALSAREEAEQLIHNGFCNAYDRWKKISNGCKSWEQEHPLIYDVSYQNKEFKIFCNIDEIERL